MRKMHTVKRLLAMLVVVCFMAAIMAGCGGAAKPEAQVETKAPVAEEKKEATKEADKVPETAKVANAEINYWNVFTGPDGKGMQGIVDNFIKENPGIKVNTQIIAAVDYYAKIVTAVASGTAPEIGIMHFDRILEFQGKGILKDTEDILKQMKLTDKDYPAMLWNASVIDGKHYGVPLDTHLFGTYYNIDLLKAAGFDKPAASKEEFIEQCKAMTKDTNGDGKTDVWGCAINSNWPAPGIFWGWATQLGAKLCLDDGETPDWDGPAGVEAAQFMHDLIYKHKVAMENLPPDGEIALFKQGKLGYSLNGIWMIADYRSQKGLNFATAPFIKIGPNPGTWAGSHHFVFYKQKSEDKDKTAAATMLADYIVRHSVDWAKAGQIPALNAVRESAEFKALPDQVGFAQGIDNVSFFPKSLYKGDIYDAPIGPALQSILTNKTTPAEGLKKAADEAKKAVAAKK